MARLKKLRIPKVNTVIGGGTEITGNLHFGGGLHLDGAIVGNVTGDPATEATLTVSEQGRITGDVRVKHMILNGAIVGDVYVHGRAELAPNASITGTLYYNLLEMAMGAAVNGQLVHSEEDEQRMLGYDGEEEAGSASPASPGPAVADIT